MAKTPNPEKPARKLSNFLCFAVYSANLAFGRVYKPVLDELGLTYPQYIAMVALREDGEQTVSALGEKMFLESNTLTPLLKKLEAAGYVKRQRDAKDERQVHLTLTPAGKKLLEKDFSAGLIKACGLGEDFSSVQKSVAGLRDNMLKAMKVSKAGKA